LCVVQHEFCTINSKFKFLSCVYAELCFWIQLVCSAGSGGRLQGLSGAPDAPYPQMNTAGQDMSRDLLSICAPLQCHQLTMVMLTKVT